jgi:hypothetical protein
MNVLNVQMNSRTTSLSLVAMRPMPSSSTSRRPAGTVERAQPRPAPGARIAQEDARALVDAGFMPLDHYLALASRYGWRPPAELEGERPSPLLRAV